MRVCHVTDWYLPRPGGMELHVRDLARELNRAGHQADILCATPEEGRVSGRLLPGLWAGPGPKGPGMRRASEGLLPGQQADVLCAPEPGVRRFADSLLPGLQSVWKPGTLRRVEEHLRAGRYDVVHCHTAFSPLSLLGCLAARRLGLPSVLTEHSVMGWNGRLLLRFLHLLLRWGGWPDVLSAVSRFVAEEMRRATGRAAEVLPNGVRPELWTSGAPQHPPTVVSVMRLRPRKRPLDFVRAIPEVLRRSALAPRFVLVGDGPERAKVERAALDLGVSSHLELPGWQPRERIREILSRAWLFALPTWNEALSLATLEALSSGLPAVCMSRGGVGDIVTHGREGYLARDFEEWVDGIVRLCREEQLRHAMAARAQAAAAPFAWPRVLERHLEVYELARRRASRR